MLGTRIFDYVVKDVDLVIGRVRCIHFAINEREFNIAVREHVEALDRGERAEEVE